MESKAIQANVEHLAADVSKNLKVNGNLSKRAMTIATDNNDIEIRDQHRSSNIKEGNMHDKANNSILTRPVTSITTHTDIANTNQEELSRVAKMDVLEAEFLNNISNKIESFYVKIGNSNYIWTIVVLPKDSKMISKRPMVFIHGLCAGSIFWLKMMDKVSKNRICYFIDLPGFAKSSRPDFSNNIDVNESAIFDFLDQWRQSLSLPTFDLVGHSFGGYVSLGFALRYPKYINNIFLLDPWGIFSPKIANAPTKIGDQEINIVIKAALLGFKILSPLTVMRKTGTFGKYIIARVRNQLYSNFENLISRNSFFDYIYYSNSGEPTGEKLFKSLHDNIYFAQRPMADRVDKLDEKIQLFIFIGETSFVNRLNATVGQQVESVLGKSRVYYEVVKDTSHHLYGYDSFIDIFCQKIDQLN